MPATVTVEVYNMLGQKVRTLVNRQFQAADYYLATWNGRDEVGKEAQALQQVRTSLQAVAAQLDELTGQLPLAASQYFDAARQSAARFFQQLDGQAHTIVGEISILSSLGSPIPKRAAARASWSYAL